MNTVQIRAMASGVHRVGEDKNQGPICLELNQLSQPVVRPSLCDGLKMCTVNRTVSIILSLCYHCFPNFVFPLGL